MIAIIIVIKNNKFVSWRTGRKFVSRRVTAKGTAETERERESWTDGRLGHGPN